MALRTQDLFENADRTSTEEAIHPLERHKFRNREHVRPSTRQLTKKPKNIILPNVPRDTNLMVSQNGDPHLQPLSAVRSHDPRLQAPITNGINSPPSGTPQQPAYASIVTTLPQLQTQGLPCLSSPSLEISVYSAEGVLLPFEDLVCEIGVGKSNHVVAEPALCVPQADRTIVEWHQTCSFDMTQADDKLSIGIYSATHRLCVAAGEVQLDSFSIPCLSWFNLGSDARILLNVAYTNPVWPCSSQPLSTATDEQFFLGDLYTPGLSQGSGSTDEFLASPFAQYDPWHQFPDIVPCDSAGSTGTVAFALDDLSWL